MRWSAFVGESGRYQRARRTVVGSGVQCIRVSIGSKGGAPSSASTTFPPENRRLLRRFLRGCLGGLAITSPRLPIQSRTHPIELQVDGFLHERVMVEARPMHELDR